MDDDEEVFGAWDEEQVERKQQQLDARHRKVAHNQQLLRASIVFYAKDKKRAFPESGPSKRQATASQVRAPARASRVQALGPAQAQALAPAQARAQAQAQAQAQAHAQALDDDELDEESEVLAHRFEALRSARTLYQRAAEQTADAAAIEYFSAQLRASEQTYQESRHARRKLRKAPQ